MHVIVRCKPKKKWSMSHEGEKVKEGKMSFDLIKFISGTNV
jgi:hypothetical protein